MDEVKKYCMNCGKGRVSKITHTCKLCGTKANFFPNFCFNCGIKKSPTWVNCSNQNPHNKCNTKLVWTGSRLIMVFLSFFIFMPFQALYLKKWVSSIIRILAYGISFAFMIHENSSDTVRIIGVIGLVFVAVWNMLDLLKAFMGKVVDKNGLRTEPGY